MARKKPTDQETARDCLRRICADPEARDADRIAAAKLLLDGEEACENTLTVVTDSLPRDYFV